ncbi:MAG: hypothetical protein N2508_15535 [Anaerolineae bacterium]|nr:hypothetical protein [Anaerolineae bacterium]
MNPLLAWPGYGIVHANDVGICHAVTAALHSEGPGGHMASLSWLTS